MWNPAPQAARLDMVLRAADPSQFAIVPVEDAPSPGRPHILQIRLANMLRNTRESADIAYARTTSLIEIDRRVLLLLETLGDLAPVRISFLLGIDKAQVSRAVKRLESKQLVAREGVRSPLGLTASGRLLARRIGSLADLRNRELTCTLSAPQMAAFMASVQALTERAILLLEQERKRTAALTNPPGGRADDDEPALPISAPKPSHILPALTGLSVHIGRSAALAFRRIAGLSNFEACVLIAIGEAAPLRWPDLVTALGRDQSQAARTICLLTGIGLIGRSGGPERRDGAFALTDKGKHVLALLDEAGRQRSAFLTRTLPAGQMRDFTAIFDIVADNAAAQLARERTAGRRARTDAGRHRAAGAEARKR